MVSRLVPLLTAPLLLLAACPGGTGNGPGDSEDRHQSLAAAWIAADDAALAAGAWAEGRPGKPVIVYADRSRSMRGFLDPSHPNAKGDFRAIIDGLQARLGPARIYGYGSAVREVPDATLERLGDRAFYDEGDTEMEEAVELVEADTAAAHTHLIVGDARRGTTGGAYRQFAELRGTAQEWAERGGTFVVGVTLAPFVPVPGDPSGCHAGDGSGAPLSCPLYVFAFAAPGDGVRIAQVLSETFDHIWAFPVPTAPGAMIALAGDSVPGGLFEPAWHRGGSTSIARFEADTATVVAAVVRPSVAGADAGRGHLLRRLLEGESVRTKVFARALADGEAGAWVERPATGGAVRFRPDWRRLELFSGGTDAPRTLYRLELHPSGAPAWLEAFDADSAGDRERTFALGRLFETSKASAAEAPRLAHAYLLVR